MSIIIALFASMLGVGEAEPAISNQAVVRLVGQSQFKGHRSRLLDFTLDGNGSPVQSPGGTFDMITEYQPIGIEFDNSAVTFNWIFVENLPQVSGSIREAISKPVVVSTFGFTAVHFATPVRAAGITVILEDMTPNLFVSGAGGTFDVDDSFIIATEKINGVTYNAFFLGVASNEPFTLFTFGIPQGGDFLMDDLVYIPTPDVGPGDINSDGAVDSGDLVLVLGALGTDAEFADLNDDGRIDSNDIGILVRHMCADCP